MLRNGEIFDERYRIVRLLGRGGYGSVYLAEELATEAIFFDEADSASPEPLRNVAVKVFSEKTADNRRFIGEVQALCSLQHPNIVGILSFGRTDVPYVAMEYIEGERIDEFAGTGEDKTERTLRALIDVADALGAAHERGIVHRDLKPGNILVSQQGVAKILDFGLAWLLLGKDEASRRIGTPGYLAPELIENNGFPCDHRADIYGLGVTIHSCLAGKTPFSGRSILGTVRRQMSGEPDIAESLPPAIARLIRACLAVEPHQRPQTAFIVAEELRQIMHGLNGTACGDSWPFESTSTTVDVRNARVRERSAFKHATRGDGVRLMVDNPAAVDDDEAGVFAYMSDTSGRASDSASALNWSWTGAEFNLLDAELVSDSQGRSFFSTSNQSLAVLEPRYPVAVTEIARAHGLRSGTCATRTLVDLRESVIPNRHLLLGSIAHDVLEFLVADGAGDDRKTAFRTAFERSLSRNRISAIAAGLDDDDLDILQRDIAKHFLYLARWIEDEGPRGRTAEAERVSPSYGVEGRIDLAALEDDKLEIIELKTGGYESPEHDKQLRIYSLLWDGVASSLDVEMQGTIVYSKKGHARRVRTREHREERRMLHARNDIVALNRLLSAHDTTYTLRSFQATDAHCMDGPCKFRREDCKRQFETMGSPPWSVTDKPVDAPRDELVSMREYYWHFVRLIEREHFKNSIRWGETFRPERLEDRCASHRALTDVTIEAVRNADSELILRVDHGGAFAAGDSIVLHRGDVDASPIIMARVRAIDEHRLYVTSRASTFATYFPREGWIAEERVFRGGRRKLHRSLYSFVSSKHEDLRSLLLEPSDAPAIVKQPTGHTPLNVVASDLNVEQRAAVALAHSGVHGARIEGPPGTGKTTVIAEIVAEALRRGERVLLAAGTNTAVDTLLARCIQRGVRSITRIGNANRATSDVLAALDNANLSAEDVFTDDIQRESSSLAQLKARLCEGAVVAATAYACVEDPLFSVFEADGDLPFFDLVVVDEAGQLSEPQVLAPLLRARRFVLVGDVCQLPPVVASRDARSEHLTDSLAETVSAIGLAGLERSLFERLVDRVPTAKLQRQYRMNHQVQAFPNQSFYANQLLSDESTHDAKLPFSDSFISNLAPEMARRVDPARGSVWIHHRAADSGAAAQDIAETVEQLVAGYYDADLAPTIDSVGIVTPYRANVRAIREAIRVLLPADIASLIEVDTVERFQGREKDAILIDLATDAWSSFVFDRRRLNVALTRARFKTIIWGPRDLGRRMVEIFAGETSVERPAEVTNERDADLQHQGGQR